MLISNSEQTAAVSIGQKRLEKMQSLEWLGQTVASIAWIASVFTYGIKAPGDWLQLLAASAWLMANIGSIWSTDTHQRADNR